MNLRSLNGSLAHASRSALAGRCTVSYKPGMLIRPLGDFSFASSWTSVSCALGAAPP
jgi:hypothetical protein